MLVVLILLLVLELYIQYCCGRLSRARTNESTDRKMHGEQTPLPQMNCIVDKHEIIKIRALQALVRIATVAIA